MRVGSGFHAQAVDPKFMALVLGELLPALDIPSPSRPAPRPREEAPIHHAQVVDPTAMALVLGQQFASAHASRFEATVDRRNQPIVVHGKAVHLTREADRGQKGGLLLKVA